MIGETKNNTIHVLPFRQRPVEHEFLIWLGLPTHHVGPDGNAHWVDPRQASNMVASWAYRRGYQHYSPEERKKLAHLLIMRIPYWPGQWPYGRSALTTEANNRYSVVREEALFIMRVLELWAEKYAEGYRKEKRKAKDEARRRARSSSLH